MPERLLLLLAREASRSNYGRKILCKTLIVIRS